MCSVVEGWGVGERERERERCCILIMEWNKDSWRIIKILFFFFLIFCNICLSKKEISNKKYRKTKSSALSLQLLWPTVLLLALVRITQFRLLWLFRMIQSHVRGTVGIMKTCGRDSSVILCQVRAFFWWYGTCFLWANLLHDEHGRSVSLTP